MAEEMICKVCEASFRASAMVGDKCQLCVELYPKAKTKEDIKVKTKNKAKTLTEETVKEIVYEILEEANLKRVKCENCSKLFFKRGPAQKYCDDCKNLKGVK